MLHIVGRTQICVCLCTSGHTIRLELADEQQHPAATLHVVDIALTGWRIIRCCTLALPMEQAFIDGVIVVHGRGRIVLVCLVQCHKEHIQLFLRQPLHTLTHSAGLNKVHGHQQLITGIGAMQIQQATATRTVPTILPARCLSFPMLDNMIMRPLCDRVILVLILVLKVPRGASVPRHLEKITQNGQNGRFQTKKDLKS